MGIDAAPFVLGIVFIIVFPAPVRGFDGVDSVLFRKVIALHNAADPVVHGGADKDIDQIRVIAQHIITAPSHDHARALSGQGLNDNGLCYICLLYTSLGCGVCARNCNIKAIELKRRPEQIITPVNSTHRFVLQAIEKGTLQNLVFDNQAFANHRAMAALFSAILDLPPIKQAMASKQFKSVYLDRLLSMQSKRKKEKFT